jgi:hypothetical protein
MLFLIPFVLVGAFFVYLAINTALIATGVGRTVVEVSKARLAPGESVDLHVSQSGKMDLNRLTVTLVCEEMATYTVGTNSRTARKKFFELVASDRSSVSVRPGSPVEMCKTVKIPDDAMHSFKARHNQIHWRFEVKGDVARWPDFDRFFPILVEPRAPVKTKNTR